MRPPTGSLAPGSTYEELQELLKQLYYSPLAIELVLPALRERSLATLRQETLPKLEARD